MTGTPLLTGTLPGVPGDVSAVTKLIFTDLATQARRFIEVGIQQRWYQGLDLTLDTGSELSATGFAGASTTRSGSYNTNVLRATVTTNEVTVCSTGDRGHIGGYRVWARAYATSTDVRVRLAWQQGGGQFHSNAYVTPVAANAFVELDLGTVTIDQAVTGTQQWRGFINALSSTVGDTLDVDYLLLIPTDSYSKLLAAQRFETVTAFSARDEFDQSAGALAGKTLPVGGTWSGAGDADDFSVETAGHTAERTATSDGGLDINAGRFEIAGSATFTDVLVQIDVKSSSAGTGRMGVHARYTDTNNWLWAVVRSGGSTSTGELFVSKKVAGSVTILVASYPLPFRIENDVAYSVRLLVDASGRWLVWVWRAGSAALAPVGRGVDADLKTGGALASGKVGVYEFQGGVAATRNFDNFFAAVPQANDVLASGKQVQVRSDGALAQDATGTYSAPWTIYGSEPEIQPAGAENRTTRIAARALDNNPDEMANATVTRALAVQAVITPRYLVPR